MFSLLLIFCFHFYSIHLLISTVITLVGVILALDWKDSKRCEAYFIMIYLRVGFWVISLLLHCFVKRSHENLRLNGYHEFHRSMKTHKSVPLFVVTLWNTAILTLESLMQHLYGKFETFLTWVWDSWDFSIHWFQVTIKKLHFRSIIWREMHGIPALSNSLHHCILTGRMAGPGFC